MTVRILCATNAGATEEVAEYIAELLTAQGHVVKVQKIETATAEDLSGADVILLGSCTWERQADGDVLQGQLQQHMYAFTESVLAAKKTYPNQKYSVFGLGDKNYTHFCNAAIRLQTFVKELQGVLIGEPLHINQYYFHLQENRTIVQTWAERLLAKIA